MEKGRALFDASAYMLFEASGDSESKYFDGGSLEELEYSDAAAEDDAQSCSYELVKKSKTCDPDSTAKVMNDEKERDKLFWEACLAS
ncbi:hypothetical protein BUALT_Bualt02G0227100 [Buddleja alternifolia]|uniref:Uncharacterized protein n=1 Tax=Buddleja alternifolia TaxID=168488 RepID=A0AAV6Y999_9LAMI|nr:hypothetical protein BUALT_Bualt02G0227100 [Buddleja alternifolia]